MRGAHANGAKEYRPIDLPIWQELLVGIELVYLRISPVYWGLGVPAGDGSAVVVVPGFLGTNLYLSQLRAWLRRIGYETYDSGISLNAECPNLLIEQNLQKAIQTAWKATGKKVHLVGHSLGGLIARAAAAQRPDQVASVITLGSPMSLTAHSVLLRTAEAVRKQILERHGEDVLPGCYTGGCTCAFLESLMGRFPKGVRLTSVYTRSDGLVDWKSCRTGDPKVDVEVSSTHLGLVFSPIVYSLIAHRLAGR